jgi:hypothetical protein
MITGHVARFTEHLARPRSERLTATTPVTEGIAPPLGLTALEAECRVLPPGPEGTPGIATYSLARSVVLSREEASFIAANRLSLVAVYRSGVDPAHTAPAGFPDAIILAEDPGARPAFYLREAGRWSQESVDRYTHEAAAEGHPVAAGFLVAGLTPPALALDLGTFPVQWMLAVWFDVTPF